MTRQITAFDIGDSMVKLVTLSGGQVANAVSLDLPDQVVAGGQIQSMDAMADFLREETGKSGIRRSAAAIILPEQEVFTRTVTVPPMTDGQLQYNLPYEFRDYLTQDKSKYFFDYAVQDIIRDEAGQPTEMRLFVCATLKETINRYRDMFRRAGFRLRAAVPQEYATGALVSDYMQRIGQVEGDYCLVDIGHRSIRIDIFRNGEFQIRRSVEMGLGDLEEIISRERGVDIHMAHTHLLTDYRGALSEDSSLSLYSQMAIEIMKSVNFYNYNNRDQSLHRVYLCGGGAEVEPLRDTIDRVTHLEIHSAAELIPGSDNIDRPWLYVRAAGCALESIGGGI